MAPTSESRRCSWWKNWRATGTHLKPQILESGGRCYCQTKRSSSLAGKQLWTTGEGVDLSDSPLDRLFSAGKRNCTSNTFLSWGTLWDAMAIAPLRLLRLGQGSRSPEFWVSPPETRLNIPSCTYDISRPKVEAICAFLSHLQARANETRDGILDRVNGLMLGSRLWRNLYSPLETPPLHSRLRLSCPH
jgi:hypothetical protein